MRYDRVVGYMNRSHGVRSPLLVGFCLLIAAVLSACSGGETDRDALVRLYLTTDGPRWDRVDNWLSNAPTSEWYGVTTDDNGRVTELRLPDNELREEIPAELALLSNLAVLDLAQNRFSGEIPSALGQLNNLALLDLSDNNLIGEIPAELGRLTSLTTLNLGNNQLTGEIPAELGRLDNAEVLDLTDNRLVGSFAAGPSDFANLRVLSLGGNELTGCIPDAWGTRQADDVFDLEMPVSTMRDVGLPFCGYPGREDRDTLVALYLAADGSNWKNADNWLSGAPIGEWHGVTTDESGRVTELILHSNGLRGEILSKLDVLTSLTVLNLAYNDLSGEIPPRLGSLGNLHKLILSYNDMIGEIPPGLGDLNKLTLLNLAGNRLSGEIPIELGRLENLQMLDLGGNQLSGEIPVELGRLESLYTLGLEGNQLSGAIPVELGRLENLQMLDLEGNQLSGYADREDRDALIAFYHSTGGRTWRVSGNWLTNLPIGRWHGVTTDESGRVAELKLEYNQLRGPIPAELGNLVNLRALHLLNNRLLGVIPAELGKLANLIHTGPRWEWVERSDTGGIGKSGRSEAAYLICQRFKRGDTSRTGQPSQRGKARAGHQPVERGDTA